MTCVSCDICVYHLGLFVFFPGVFLSSRVTGACPVATDLIMRVNVRTTTTTTFCEDYWRDQFLIDSRNSMALSSLIENQGARSPMHSPKKNPFPPQPTKLQRETQKKARASL